MNFEPATLVAGRRCYMWVNMSISGRITGISSSAATRAVVKEALESAPTSARKELKDLFTLAAGADRNKHLSLDEAKLVKEQLAAGAELDALRASVEAQIAERTKAANLDGIKSYFTSTTKDLAPTVIEAMRDTVKAANGKPVELHAMIFAFTEKKIAAEMLQLVKDNPNVELRLIADFAQLTTAGDRQPALIHQKAKQLGISDRVSVKFKKDNPYVWDAKLKRPVYSHAMSKGLNHHKGMVTLIDGKPHKLVTGSYNWSVGASESNYESLFVIDAKNPANRKLMADYQAEFAAFFNHPDTLGVDGTKAYKAKLFSDLRVANGLAADPDLAPITQGPLYTPKTPAATFDLNQLSDANVAALEATIGSKTLTNAIISQYATYGAFTSLENLYERVPKLLSLPAETRALLESRVELGEGSVAVNSATASELMRSLKLTKTAADAIVARRTELGDFEGVEQLRGLPGISDAVFARIAPRLNDDLGRAFFSSKAVSDAAASTGYAPVNSGKTVPVLDADLDGVLISPATLSAGVLDMIRRAKPGETMRIAQYGFSITTQEYGEIINAAGRGVKFKIVLDKAGNATAAAALKTQAEAGLPIEVRVQKKTMHQKFGTLNDDAFFGSSNFSGSASNKNSEDRFLVKNNAELAGELLAEHDRLWAKSDPV